MQGCRAVCATSPCTAVPTHPATAQLTGLSPCPHAPRPPPVLLLVGSTPSSALVPGPCPETECRPLPPSRCRAWSSAVPAHHSLVLWGRRAADQLCRLAVGEMQLRAGQWVCPCPSGDCSTRDSTRAAGTLPQGQGTEGTEGTEGTGLPHAQARPRVSWCLYLDVGPPARAGCQHPSSSPAHRPAQLGAHAGTAQTTQRPLTNLRSDERLTLRGLMARSGSTAATSSPVMSPAATVFSQSEPEMLCRRRRG